MALSTAPASVTSRSARASATTSCPAERAERTTSAPSIPAAPVTRNFMTPNAYRSGRRYVLRRELAVELADLEDLGSAVRACALNRRTTVLHGHLLRVLDLDLLAFLDAVTLCHEAPPPRELTRQP